MSRTTKEPERKKPAPRPPSGFASKAVALAETVGRSREDLMKAIKRKGPSTYERLERGEGSPALALAVREKLREWGADVAQLPSMEDADVPPWKREWISVGEQIYRRDEKRFLEELARLRKLADAYALVAGEIQDLGRPGGSRDD